MSARSVIVVMFLISAATAARGEIVTYGAGLKSCAEYLDAKEADDVVEISILDWLAGYVSGVNATSNRVNNILGDTNLTGAVSWLSNYCRKHPPTPIAVALDILVVGARSTTGRPTVELTTYGAGFKSCGTYLTAREEQGRDQMAFIDWLGGYASGVNALSLSTDNVLGDSSLTGAISWLDDYCQANPAARFAAAVNASLTASKRSGK